MSSPYFPSQRSTSAPKRCWKQSGQSLVTRVWLKQLRYCHQEGSGFHLRPCNWQSQPLSIRSLLATPNMAAQQEVLVVEEVRWQEPAMRCTQAVSQAQQGQWIRWEGVERTASSCEPPTSSSHLPEPSNSSMVITQSVCVFLQQASSTSWLAPRLAWHKFDKPGGTTRCSGAWQLT